MRPRFVIVLSVAAALASSASLARLPSALGGGLAPASLIVFEAAAYLVVAVGLWRLRRWARAVTMAYLALVIAHFLFFGVSTSDGGRATAVMLWQLTAIPFATFGFMFLYNGARYFGRDHAPTQPALFERRDKGATIS